MLALTALQSTARTRLAAHATFSGEAVHVDDGRTLKTEAAALAGTSFATATRARAANVATLTAAEPHGLWTGALVTLTGLPAAYNAAGVAVTVLSDTSFSYANSGANEAATADTAGTVTAAGTGHAFTILPLLDADTRSAASGRNALDVGLAVRIALNPDKATKDPAVLLRDAIAALCVRTTQPNETFQLAEKAFTLDPSDPGLLAWLVFFEITAALG